MLLREHLLDDDFGKQNSLVMSYTALANWACLVNNIWDEFLYAARVEVNQFLSERLFAPAIVQTVADLEGLD